jgi:hypothetical protein
MADREPIVNIFGISGPSGNPVQSPATLYPRDYGRWNTFLRQYAVWPNTSNAGGGHVIYRIFDAPYTGTYYIRSSADNTGAVYINDLKVGGTTQTIERHHWWWWGGWWGGYGYGNWYGYGGWWGYWGHRTTDWSTVPTAYAITLAKGINQLRFEVSNQHDVCGFGMTIANSDGTVLWDTRSQAVVSEYTQTCGRYTLTSPIAADVVAYIWGGGGAGGGNDAGSRGGDGAPGQFHKVNFSVDVGDQIEVVVGDGGTPGGSSAGSAGGGAGGASRVNLAGFGSFSGAGGASSGPRGSSGGGGGGGGASLVIVNGIPVGIAGGGGGGGGAGNDGNSAGLINIRNATTAYPDSAQIYSGASTVELSGATEPLNGQRGQGVTGDGGGAGGGGGGWQGGSGGTVRGGDSSAYGGQTGGNYPFNQIFKHTAGNVSFIVPAGVSSISLISAVAGGAGGGSGNLTQGGGGGGEGARAKDITFSVVPGRLYEISVGDGGKGGTTKNGLYSGLGTLTDANLTFINAQSGNITSIRDTVTNTYLLKLSGGLAGNLIAGGAGGTVITNTGSGGTTSNGESGLVTAGAVGGSGGGPAAGRSSGADAITKSAQGSDFGCGSAGAGSKKSTVFAANPDDQTRPQTLSGTYGGTGANGSILIRWDEDQRVGEDGDLRTVSNTSWGTFLNTYGMWLKSNESVATVTRVIDAAYSGTYKIRAVATGSMAVLIDDKQVAATSDNSSADPTPINITLSKGIHQIKFNLNSPEAAKGFAVSVADSTDKLYWDTRDNVFTNPPGQNMRYYVAPYARGGTAGQGGANGAVALEIYPAGLCNVKVGGQWRNVSDAAVKVSGSWRDIQSIYVKVNGEWRTVDSAGDLTSLIFTPQLGNYAVSERAGVPAGPGGGGGGGGCKIICQKLAELGYFDSAMNKADQAFGIMLRDKDPDAYNGYIRWAGPVVDLLEGGGSPTFRKIVFPWIRDEQKRKDLQTKIVAHYLDVIARPWAEEMAFRMKADGYTKSNPAGKFVMDIGLPLCRTISKFGKGKQLPMWAKTALIWGTTTVLLLTVTGISTVDKTVRTIGKFLRK